MDSLLLKNNLISLSKDTNLLLNEFNHSFKNEPNRDSCLFWFQNKLWFTDSIYLFRGLMLNEIKEELRKPEGQNCVYGVSFTQGKHYRNFKIKDVPHDLKRVNYSELPIEFRNHLMILDIPVNIELHFDLF